MEKSHEKSHEWSLGGVFVYLTKQFIAKLSEHMADSPIARYYYPLYVIWKHEGSISQQDLAEYLYSDKVSLVRVLDALCDEGLIVRKKNPNDKRKHMLLLTEKAKPYMPNVEEALKKTNEYFLQHVDPAYLNEFTKTLATIVAKTKEPQTSPFNLLIKKSIK